MIVRGGFGDSGWALIVCEIYSHIGHIVTHSMSLAPLSSLPTHTLPPIVWCVFHYKYWLIMFMGWLNTKGSSLSLDPFTNLVGNKLFFLDSILLFSSRIWWLELCFVNCVTQCPVHRLCTKCKTSALSTHTVCCIKYSTSIQLVLTVTQCPKFNQSA